jgi:hypothetical protein
MDGLARFSVSKRPDDLLNVLNVCAYRPSRQRFLHLAHQRLDGDVVDRPERKVAEFGKNPLVQGCSDARSILDRFSVPSFDPSYVGLRLLSKSNLSENNTIEVRP